MIHNDKCKYNRKFYPENNYGILLNDMHGTLMKLNVLEVEPEFHILHHILLLIEVVENNGPVM